MNYLSYNYGWAYPRTGGETLIQRLFRLHLRGLSPHGRGNHTPRALSNGVRGPIPARAGKPYIYATGRSQYAAYPRTGGETLLRFSGNILPQGLSPHGRGNPALVQVQVQGPIPARAGKPIYSFFTS